MLAPEGSTDKGLRVLTWCASNLCRVLGTQWEPEVWPPPPSLNHSSPQDSSTAPETVQVSTCPESTKVLAEAANQRMKCWRAQRERWSGNRGHVERHPGDAGPSVRSGKRVGFSAARHGTAIPDQRTQEGSGPGGKQASQRGGWNRSERLWMQVRGLVLVLSVPVESECLNSGPGLNVLSSEVT